MTASHSQTLTARENVDLDNALINQKDELLRLIGGGASIGCEDMVRTASDRLRFVAPLWEAVSYGYKVREVKARIRDAAESIRETLQTAADALRRGTQQREALLTRVLALDVIVQQNS